jgi:hypothetical protein
MTGAVLPPRPPLSQGPVPSAPLSQGPVPSAPLSQGPGPAAPLSQGPVPAAPLSPERQPPRQDPRPTQPLRPVSVNLLGVVEHPVLDGPYRIDADGVPYVPAGDGGIVLGLRLGDPAFGRSADHPAPGACLVHPDPAARHALVSYACVGNQAVVRTGAAAGCRGAVIGKRGEEGRVIVGFRPGDLARMRPSDQVSVRACGQGFQPAWFPPQVRLLNLDPDLLAALPITGPAAGGGRPVSVQVRAVVPSKLAGNGLGRPSVSWDLDLQLPVPGGSGVGAEGEVLLGDLIAVSDLDARYNMGYREGWLTVGIVVHGSSPLPGHGPGITPILTGPGRMLALNPDYVRHVGLTESALKLQ